MAFSGFFRRLKGIFGAKIPEGRPARKDLSKQYPADRETRRMQRKYKTASHAARIFEDISKELLGKQSDVSTQLNWFRVQLLTGQHPPMGYWNLGGGSDES